jgi:phage terminase large subunit
VTTYTVPIPYNYAAREYQQDFWYAMANGCRRAILCWPRRNGKDKTAWNYLITQSMRKIGVYYYLFPTYSQGRKILWDGIDRDGFKFMDHIPKQLIIGVPNSSEMKIRLLNGSMIQIVGVDNIDRIVGTNPIGCVFSEYSLQDPKGWEFIRPILAENGGWAVFTYTPRGSNWGKDLYDMAVRNKNWFCQKLTCIDTGVPTQEDIELERDSGMSDDMIEQEFYTSFTKGIEGSYYAKYINKAREDGRISSVPLDPQQRVYTSWDIGYGDSTAIIFFQLTGNEIHIFDYYEAHGEGLPHYAWVLNEKGYVYADHYAPHDIDSHSFSSGLSAKEVGRDLGIRFVTLPTLKLKLEDGIEAVRGLFPRFWIDERKCADLIKAIENYRKEYDERLGTYKSKPLHDRWSHAADSLRYLSLAIKTRSEPSKSYINDEVAQRMYNEANPRFD